MIVAGSASPLLLASAAGDYNLTRSLRFRSSAGAYLNRTLTTPTNNLKWTWSAWVKRGTLGTDNILFDAGDGSGNNFGSLSFISGDEIQFRQVNSGSNSVLIRTNALFRDPSAWYHIVLVYDSANATSTDRIKIYVNNTLQTVNYIIGPFAQNETSQINSAITHYISKLSYSTFYFDGYLTEINFIDGQALTPSSFGANSATTGVWQPKKYAGTYGTNGFYLPFTDNSALTTSSNVGLGKDFSGNGNYWTTNNISITAGSTYDSMTDVPTLTSATAANFAVMNPISKGTTTTLSNGNLNFANSSGSDGLALSTIGVSSGKWYCEVTALGSDCMLGITSNPFASGSYVGALSTGYGYYQTGAKFNNGSSSAYGASYTTNDVIGIALDLDVGTLVFYKNNVSQGTAFSSLSGTFFFATGNGSINSLGAFNFGQRPFAYTPPTGFVALNTFNLPEPTIGATASTQANKYMDATTYTGTGSSLSVTNAGGFQPDWVWVKSRSAATNNKLTDSVRGVTKGLISNTTGAETTDTQGLTAFNSGGFTVGTDTVYNNSSATYVAWQWRASNATAVTNTAGSITSTVSANTSAGFSIVKFEAQASGTATVGHGLGVAPKLIFIKPITDGSEGWQVYAQAIGATKFLVLNSLAAASTNSAIFANTNPTSTVFTMGTYFAGPSSYPLIAYCFSEVAGYSSFGSYTGNGSTDGTFIYTGFKPRYIMIKRTDSTGQWVVVDTARSPSNVVADYLFANLDNAEASSSSYYLDILSNGWKIRGTISNLNASGGTYIYMAFAENPFKYSLAR
jgi:hypothetical protein